MIELTVKTLDSQNHTFTVDDDITVIEFKNKIADSVHIPADTQRIIYCGRVLQDESKLSDYDVNGKVVHLVQRPPPSANPQTPSRPTTPPLPRRGFRGFESGNTMYLGSMAFPSNLMESQGIVPPPPTHSLAGSRLNVARRMLRRAEAVINLLENPLARPNEQANAEEQAEEEVTPIIEARVMVPPGNNEPIDEAMVLSAVQDSLYAASGALPVAAEVTIGSDSSTHTPTDTPPGGSSASSTPEDLTAAAANAAIEALVAAEAAHTRMSDETTPSNSTEQGRSEGGTNARNLADNANRRSEMAELLVTLNQLQERFAPYLERYRCFMIEDPVIPQENVRRTQAEMTRISEVLHFLGHACHSLSDIIIRVRTPPPRPLLCRPILIQHSAVVQAGIPIQVEAQFNISTERPNAAAAASNSGAASNTTSTGSEQQRPTAANSSDPPSTTTTAENSGGSGVSSSAPHATFNVHGFPLLPTGAMRMHSFPIELRPATFRSGSSSSSAAAAPSAARTQNNNNNSANNSGGAPTTTAGAATATTTSSTATTGSAQAQMNNPFGASGANANPALEFFMEVNPDMMRGGTMMPPPNFMQGLMQIAGQIMTQVNTSNGSAAPSTSTTTASTSEATQQASSTTSQSTQGNNAPSSGPSQNSQARGNTQTNPTTATHTRSTPRPHVHLAQQAMQGGFDPFLPCNSHHVTSRRRGQPQHHTVTVSSGASAAPASSTPTSTPADTPPTASPRASESRRMANYTFNAIMDEIYNSLRTAGNRGRSGSAQAGETAAGDNARAASTTSTTGTSNTASTTGTTTGTSTGTTTTTNSSTSNATSTGAASGSSSRVPRFSPLMGMFSFDIANMGRYPNVRQQIANLMQSAAPNETTSQPGASVVTDLIVLLARNLSIVDMVAIGNNNLEPLNRLSNEISSFVNARILEGSNTPDAIERAVQKFMDELEPFFASCNQMRVREDVDIVASMQRLLRSRLPEIISLASSLENNVATLGERCISLLRSICALALHTSFSGQRGVEDCFRRIVTTYVQGVTPELQDWTSRTSCITLRQFMNNLDIPSTTLEQYIVRRSSESSEQETNNMTAEDIRNERPPSPFILDEPETMEVEEGPVANITTDQQMTPAPALSAGDEAEPLPNVVIGSQPWHGQVPEDWVPIITRDGQRQRSKPQQRPYSDAYLSGMPTKKRKIVNSAKPQGSLPQVISDSVRRAVTATGLTSVAPVEAVAQGAGNSGDIQTAYRNLLRSSVQSVLENNEDFTPERFPNASTYFKAPK